MTMSVTLGILVAALALVAWANWMSRRPKPDFEVRLVPYNALQFIGILVALLMVAHILTLVTGQPWRGRSPL